MSEEAERVKSINEVIEVEVRSWRGEWERGRKGGRVLRR